MGVGGGEVKKKHSRKGKLNEKNSCTPINPKKYSCYGLKKIHTRNLITEKNSCDSKISLPPYNFSNGPSLMDERNGTFSGKHTLSSTNLFCNLTAVNAGFWVLQYSI